MTRDPIVVIGAGAAGILAAWRAASLGAPVVLVEKNDRIGIKILISGGGKCNVTHDGPIEDLLKAFRPNEARFLRPSFYRFTNQDIVEMLARRGLGVYTRPDGRIFPSDGTAKDVVAKLGQFLDEVGVRVRLKSGATGVESNKGWVTGVRVGNELISSSSVILAVGGSSFPGAGTTGDGFTWARELGHTVVKVRAALAPIFLQPQPSEDWAGVALRDCVLKARQNGKEIARWRGDLLFTHRGISGPAVLGISREVAEKRERGPVSLEVDLVPEISYEDLRDRILKSTREHPRRLIKSFVEEIAPNRLVEPILGTAGIEASTSGAYLNQKDRNRLVTTLKAWSLGHSHHVYLEKGEVVAGGIALDEVDPQTMRSRICEGLYVCGEVLDVAGPVGGYNLQAAFSTGYVAGETAALDLITKARRDEEYLV